MVDDPQTPELEPTVSAPPPGQPPPQEPPEPPIVDVKGEKFVPQAALHEAREQAKAAKELQAKVQQLEEYQKNVQPWIQALAQRPDVVARLQAPYQTEAEPASSSKAPSGTQPNEELLEIAKTIGLYDAQAQPDVKAAQRVAAFIQKTAKSIAEETVKPVQEVTSRDKSAVNFQRALQIKDPDGQTARPETLRWMWNAMPAEYSADDRVASVMAYAAIGYDRVHGSGRGPTPPDRPPLDVEAPGSRTPGRVSMTDLEQRMAQLRGMSQQGYQAAVKGFREDRPNILED